MYRLATSLSVQSTPPLITHSPSELTLRAGLASLASYVQLTKPMFFFVFFFQLFFPKSLSSYIRILSLFIIYDSYFALSLALEQALRGAPSNYVSGI